MEWKVHYFDRRAGQVGVSRSHSTSEGALRNACDLMRQNCRVDYITGLSSLPGNGLGRETFDATLYAGIRLWQGAELWISPEIDQGFGFANTHGVAGFPSGESYKLGSSYPYTRMQRINASAIESWCKSHPNRRQPEGR
jgi:Carbohydrate-selective porin, OprB family